MPRCHILITGKVQGVSYRAFAKAAAAKTSVAGYARNLADGRVEVVAEGDEFDLMSFAQLLHTGPDAAVIENFEIAWNDAKNEFTGFSIIS